MIKVAHVMIRRRSASAGVVREICGKFEVILRDEILLIYVLLFFFWGGGLFFLSLTVTGGTLGSSSQEL